MAFSNKLTKVAALALLSSSFFLASCDKINELVSPVDGQQQQSTQQAEQAPTTTAPAVVDTNLEATDFTNYLGLSANQELASLVQQEDVVAAVGSYANLSKAYKKYLHDFAGFANDKASADYLNSLYTDLAQLENAPNQTLIIFYIDALRYLQEGMQDSFRQLEYTDNITKDTVISPEQRKQILANVANTISRKTETFFSMHQFLGAQDLGISAELQEQEFNKYIEWRDKFIELNQVLVANDNTCSVNYQKAGDVMNCLVFKYYLAFEAFDSELVTILKNYIIKNSANTAAQENLNSLAESFKTKVFHSLEQYQYYTELLGGKK